MTDAVAPVITAVSFPAEGKATTGVVDRFSVTFSKDVAPATIEAIGSAIAALSPDTLEGSVSHFAATFSASGITSKSYSAFLNSTCAFSSASRLPMSA